MAAILMLLICTFIDCLYDMPLTSHVGNSHVVRSHSVVKFIIGSTFRFLGHSPLPDFCIGEMPDRLVAHYLIASFISMCTIKPFL